MSDFLDKNPLTIVRLSPAGNPNKGHVKTLLIGHLPNKIQVAIKKHDMPTIKSYFGPKWKNLLDPNIEDILSIKGSMDLESLLDIEENSIIPKNENAITHENENIMSMEDVPVVSIENKQTIDKNKLGFSPADSPLPKSGETADISSVAIFPEDNLQEFKEKLYVATGVPVQRQHIFWLDDVGNVKTTYKVKTSDGGEINIDARNLLKLDEKEDAVFGIKIDRYFYENWKDISVIAMDTFKTVEDVIIGTTNVIFMIDLADLFYNFETLVVLANNKSKLDLLYYSIVYKYWPWLPNSEDILNDYNISNIYPLLAPKRSSLIKKFQIESGILLKTIVEKRILETNITMAITSVATGARINIRNLFDKIETSKEIPHVNAYIQEGAVKYNLVKHYIGTPFVHFPPQTRSGLTIALPLIQSTNYNLQNLIESYEGSKKTNIYLNIQPNGTYYILSHFGDEQNIDFAALIELLIKLINPVIDTINSYSEYIFMGVIKKLDYISEVNARYPDINISLNWKKQLSEGGFKVLKKEWIPYEEAGIINIKPVTFGTNQNIMMEINFLKGCTEYDIGQITRSSVLANIKNYYTHLTNPTVNYVWNKLYHGRIVHMVQRTSDIQFNLFNMTQNNYLRFKNYLLGYLNNIINKNLLPKAVVLRTNVKKLKALQETDPELYDLRKHGAKRLYTVVCQEPRQPLIYSKLEDAPKKAIKYVNMTTHEPAYYYCDTKMHPVLSFITGVHPLGYCLPCCKKKKSLEGSEKYKEDETCFNTTKATAKDFIDTGKLDSEASQHIMTYGKEIPKYRLGYAHKDIIDYLASVDVLNYKNLYMYGVGNVYRDIDDACILDALAFTVGTTTDKLVEDFIKYIKIMGVGYESLMGGEIVEWFENVESLISALHKLFIIKEQIIIHFNKWLDLFSELYRLIVNSEVIIFNNGVIEYGGSNKKTTIILVKNKTFIYPIVEVDMVEYYKTNNIKRKTFDNPDKIMGPVLANFPTDISNNILNHLMKIDSSFKLCITSQRIAYGVINDNAFITFKPIYIPGNIPIYNEPPEPKKYNESLKILEQLKIKDSTILKEKNKITLVNNNIPLAIAHIKTEDNDTDVWKDIILMTAPNDQFQDVLNKALAKHNLYNLFLLYFTSYADKHKNAELRKELKKLISDVDVSNFDSIHNFTKFIKTKIDNSIDIGVINSILAQNINNKNKVLEIIDNKKFNFDKNNYYEMAKMPDAQLKKEIDEFIKGHIELIDDYPPIPKNLTLPVGKLKMPKDIINELSDILISDLHNPLKLELLKSGALSNYLLIDMFKFERRPHENIKIVQA